MRAELVSIRPLTGDDGPTVETVFAGLSARSRYLRFHTPQLHGYVLPENREALRLLEQVFPGAVRHPEKGVIRVDCPLSWSGWFRLTLQSGLR